MKKLKTNKPTTIGNRVQWVELIQTTDFKTVKSAFQYPTCVQGYRGAHAQTWGSLELQELARQWFSPLLSPLIILGLKMHSRGGFIIQVALGPLGSFTEYDGGSVF